MKRISLQRYDILAEFSGVA